MSKNKKGYLESSWTLIEKINNFPEGKRKEKILAFIEKKKSVLPNDTRGSFTSLLYRGNLQNMVENFRDDSHIIWNLLDDYLEGNEI